MTDSTTNHPVVLFVRGRPGSGKSYLAARLEEALGKERVVMLDPDTIDFDTSAYKAFAQAQAAEGVDPKIYPFRYLKSQAFECILAGKIIIWNQPFTNRGMFDRLASNLQEFAAEHGASLTTLLVEVDIDVVTAKERVLQRKLEGGHGPSENTLDRRIHDYESFASGYETITVDGQGDVTASVATVREALQKAGVEG